MFLLIISYYFIFAEDEENYTSSKSSTTSPSSHHNKQSGHSAEDVQKFHVHKDATTGGHWCAKLVFFILMAALVGLIGLIILENRGLTDCKLFTFIVNF